MKIHIVFLDVLFFFVVTFAAPIPPHLTKSLRRQPKPRPPRHYFELTRPLPTDNLSPSCSLLAFRRDFGGTYGLPPFSVPYATPSNCSWSSVVLDFRASSTGEQYDRIAGVWLSGAEILRTSTAEPDDEVIFWTVRKDVTKYASLLARSNLTLSVMLENIVDENYTGVYHVNITFFYYQASDPRPPLIGLPSHQELANDRRIGNNSGSDTEYVDSVDVEKRWSNIHGSPANLIIPISGDEGGELWFRVQGESDAHSREIRIPRNTFRAVLEVYVSFHGDDEFWYSNPPDAYIRTNNLTTGRGHGAFREVMVMIDGHFVGSVLPFPVIFTGGINPLFWEPMVAIGAFDLPSYDFELTPLLGMLLDGKPHSIGLEVANGIPFWLLDANLHIWLDHNSTKVYAKIIDYSAPRLLIKRYAMFKQLNGSFKIKAARSGQLSGWVLSSAGNLTTRVAQNYKLNNLIVFQDNGTSKMVNQNIKARTRVTVGSGSGSPIATMSVKRNYPLSMMTSTVPLTGKDAYLTVTNVSHAMKEKSVNGGFKVTLNNLQKSGGWMFVKGHSVLQGSTSTHQVYRYRDGFGSYSRTVTTVGRKVVNDSLGISISGAASL